MTQSNENSNRSSGNRNQRRRRGLRGGGDASKGSGGNSTGGNSGSGGPKRRRRRRRRRGGGGPKGGGPKGGGAKSGGGGGPEREVRGYLELTRNQAGVLREGCLAGANDPHIPVQVLRSRGLREGDFVEGMARGNTVKQIVKVNGREPENLEQRTSFDSLTAIHPEHAFLLGPTDDAITGRLLDIIAPVGRGQRGLIVAPPKAGKTTLLKEIARGLEQDPGIELITILVGERPEEVTDMRRTISGTILASDLDMPSTDHIRVANLGIAHAKRLVEEGRHVVVLMDSLTRMARAVNLNTRGGGRTLSGGMEASALQPVRKFFGAARATDEGGSLTILATCLVDTGSRLDDVVYEEFKGTGNMEVHLDRKLAQMRLFPAVNIRRSGTRREELLLDKQTLEHVRGLRRKLSAASDDDALSALLTALQRQPVS